MTIRANMRTINEIKPVIMRHNSSPIAERVKYGLETLVAVAGLSREMRQVAWHEFANQLECLDESAEASDALATGELLFLDEPMR